MGSETHAFPPKLSKKKDGEDFERFAEMIRPIFLHMRLTDMLKTNPYAKYMKDIITKCQNITFAIVTITKKPKNITFATVTFYHRYHHYHITWVVNTLLQILSFQVWLN